MKKIFSFFLLLILISPPVLSARTLHMMFWYPGEAGTTEDAQPVLDAFALFIEPKIAPDKIKPTYFNTADAGLKFIRAKKPQMAIISRAAWEQYRSQFPQAQEWLLTLPLPGGKPSEVYSLMCGPKNPGNGSALISSQPLSQTFVKRLFPTLTGPTQPTQTAQMLMDVQKIAQGKPACAILSPAEQTSLTAFMQQDWGKQLKNVMFSTPVPSAPLVLFDPALASNEHLRTALLKLSSDPQTSDILEEMRLAGFTMP